MKRKLLIIFATLAVAFGAFGTGIKPAHATTYYDTPSVTDNHSDLGAPYYGGTENAIDQTWDSDTGGQLALLGVSIGTGADYTDHPTSWDYPTPGIPYNWLEAREVVQYDDNGDGIPDGTCSSGIGTWDWTIANTAGSYGTPLYYKQNYTENCPHLWLRVVIENHFDAGGLGWHTHTYTAYFLNQGYYCETTPTGTNC